MKRIITAALFLILLAGCGGSVATRRVDELQAKHDLLAKRVKSLEDELLTAQKQLIAQQQMQQTIRERQREMEAYFDRLQVSQARK